jgi:hypothetical protein
MPAKQTRESIEAELNATERERLAQLPAHLKAKLAAQTDAELSSAERLAAIVDQRREGS